MLADMGLAFEVGRDSPEAYGLYEEPDDGYGGGQKGQKADEPEYAFCPP